MNGVGGWRWDEWRRWEGVVAVRAPAAPVVEPAAVPVRLATDEVVEDLAADPQPASRAAAASTVMRLIETWCSRAPTVHPPLTNR